MGKVLLIAAAISLAACAAGRIDADGRIHGVALGDGARLERCVPAGEAGVIASAPEACSRVVGAPLLPSLLDGAAAIVKALFTWALP